MRSGGSERNKNKLYSIDAPEVECISKRKAHKRYECGCKVSVTTTNVGDWVVGVQTLHGNPYDRHTFVDNWYFCRKYRRTGSDHKHFLVAVGGHAK